MYKVKNSLCPRYVGDLFHTRSSGYDLRNADFQIQRFNTVTYGKHSIQYFGPYVWSRLNSEDRPQA